MRRRESPLHVMYAPNLPKLRWPCRLLTGVQTMAASRPPVSGPPRTPSGQPDSRVDPGPGSRLPGQVTFKETRSTAGSSFCHFFSGTDTSASLAVTVPVIATVKMMIVRPVGPACFAFKPKLFPCCPRKLCNEMTLACFGCTHMRFCFTPTTRVS